MPRLRWLPEARRDLLDIIDGILRGGGSKAVALRFTDQLRQRCNTLAALPGTMGRARPELGPGLRSVAHGEYVVFFRYFGDKFEVVGIVHGRRDIDHLFES